MLSFAHAACSACLELAAVGSQRYVRLVGWLHLYGIGGLVLVVCIGTWCVIMCVHSRISVGIWMVHVDCGFLCGVVDVSHSRWRSCPGRDESGRVVPPEKRSTALINVVRGGGDVSVYVCVMPSTEHCRLCRGRGTGDAMDVWSSQRRGGIHHRS